jgi:hypothetical protein
MGHFKCPLGNSCLELNEIYMVVVYTHCAVPLVLLSQTVVLEDVVELVCNGNI